ncbi:unnamed protein product, partial [Allacma fusca]
MKPELACFQPEGCRACLLQGKYYVETESRIFCCITHPRKLDVNIIDLFTRPDECPDEEIVPEPLFSAILEGSFGVLVLLVVLGLVIYCC